MKNPYKKTCAGWYLQDLGSRETYIELIEMTGPCWCDIHKQDAYLCFEEPINHDQ